MEVHQNVHTTNKSPNKHQDEHVYSEPQQFPTNSNRMAMKKWNTSAWSVLFIITIVLLCLMLLLLVVVIVIIMSAGTCSSNNLSSSTDLANKVSQSTFQLFQTNFTEVNKKIFKLTKESARNHVTIANTLSNMQDTSTFTAAVIDNILLLVQELLVIHNDSSSLPTSCKEIRKRQPSSPSGVYLLAKAVGSPSTYFAYCHMEELCNSEGGWTRVAYLDMSDATQNCPSGLRLYQSGGIRVCGRPSTSSGSCGSVQFPSNGISYSQICGRVTGYQFDRIDAVHTPSEWFRNDLNSYYVEGVSITRGVPRQHVWTLMAGYTETNANLNDCPCNNGSKVVVKSFIGENYFCESGNTASTPSHILYTSDPLRDGQGCDNLETSCCDATGIPWFHRDYKSNTTTDFIELRVCADYATSDEDSPLSHYEIYVK
uniref:Fibrinogen C-terminal domain-containing protein n=1 Tax=Amphimedon queenslandica TaxID=400682 RepID=A0A1X7US41_AMPQE